MLSDTPGVHHVSVVAGDPQRTVDFYTEVLGLRFVLRTVNFEDKFVYHLYFGDSEGRPGTVLTTFAYPADVEGRDGRPGIPSVQFSVPPDSLGAWTERLAARDIDTEGPSERFGERRLSLSDPDGTRIELIEDDAGEIGGGDAVEDESDADAWTSPVPADAAIRGVRGVSVRSTSPYVTASLLQTLGFELVAETDDAVRYRLPDGRESVVDLLLDDAPYGREGRGSIHHVAFGVGSEAELHEWRELLDERGFDVSRVKDRNFFHSLYVRDPGGVLFELCTERPGLGVDATDGAPGASLRLPSWLEEDREMIQSQLPTLTSPEGRDGDGGEGGEAPR
ncbi:VOC family protein [Halopelagius longus]|uniref:Glyoxalase family protein n=1 Tax=Halopelagius longus TaxID=1236180 RepID=A0A1H0XN59_9EURY|nr:VOC family protein [Halopelagius longus]RDI71944.1 ring-cleaving dioxygenase [Halopelagius longus]SDQ04334.1 glyoxalase family protein [Halopelagius longus]